MRTVVSTPMRHANVMRLNGDGERELFRCAGALQAGTMPRRATEAHACARRDHRARPTFAWAFAGTRGILMVSTFNEGEELPNGKTTQ